MSSVSAKPTRVVIDALVAKPGLGGIATYIRGVSEGLLSQPDIALSVLTSAPDVVAGLDADVVLAPAGVRSFASRITWRERNLRAIADRLETQVLFSATIELPVRRLPIPSILTVHDVGPLELRSAYGSGLWLRYRLGLPPTLARADRIICVSEATRQALDLHTRRRFDNVVVIGECPQTLPAPQPTASGCARPYILTVGAMLPHKNIETLVVAMADERMAGYDLIVAGPLNRAEKARFDGWRRQVRDSQRVSHRGFVSTQDLANLYHSACLVALPSLHEGFGLPVLEAMAAGTPVLASGISAFREVGADAASYVSNPTDPRAWSAAMHSLLSDSARLRQMQSAGLEKANTMTWESVGDSIAAAIRELAHPNSQ